MVQKKEYHKLVRDRIPQIIKKDGNRCVTRVLSREEYLQKLDEKLEEELAEYRRDGSLEELADLLEVMEAAVKARGYTWEELRHVQAQKREKRGGFENRLLLEYVEEQEEA